MAQDTKRLLRVVALIEVDAATDNDALTIGGNLARQVAGAIPVHYNTRGVELESVTPVEGSADDNVIIEKQVDKDTNVNAQRRAATEKANAEKVDDEKGTLRT